MRTFVHINPGTLDEAIEILGRYGERASVIAGGTDLIGKMKDEVLPIYPEAILDLKSIPGLEYIQEADGVLKIGALARLADIASHPVVRQKYTALAEAARRTATPQIREMGTIAGNLCQDIRCWYYRNPNNRFPCLRKGGGRCYALEGDNRYHSIFGGSVEDGCIAVHPSDIAPALIALDARMITSKKTIKAEKFFEVGVCTTTVLDHDELLIEIHIPEPRGKSAFIKFALRKSIDFPIVNCASMLVLSKGIVSEARICLNAVYVIPYRALSAENTMLGHSIAEASAEIAGEAAVAMAMPLEWNEYMVPIARTLVKRTIMACG
jgi:xanthine dehydrogenase YagS FAD-binding subunit